MFDLILGYFYPLLFGFIVGSLPTTYLLVKWRKRLDIREAGTGNVGAMNVYDVTGSKAFGLVILAVDLVKALASVLLAGEFFGQEYWTMGAAGLGAMLGHNYSPWLGFRGGRGLVTAFGVSLVLGWVFAALWLVFFGVTYALRRDIHTGNIVSTIVSPAVLAAVPGETMRALVPGREPADVVGLSILIGILILLGHFKIIVRFFQSIITHQ